MDKQLTGMPCHGITDCRRFVRVVVEGLALNQLTTHKRETAVLLVVAGSCLPI